VSDGVEGEDTAPAPTIVPPPETDEETQHASDEDNADKPPPAPVYEPNPKHKEPWQRGARGSLCPAHADGPVLFASSEVDPRNPGKRYATDGRQPYCGQEHRPGRWHGYLVQWREVPATLRRQWVADKKVSKRDLREHW
jgi:hypothetical protein